MSEITKPGVYRLSHQTYHADPAPEPSLSSSLARVMIERSPLHAAVRHPKLARDQIVEHKPIFDLGTAAHALLLHDEITFAVCEEDDWRSKAARELREEAWADGRTPILERQLEETRQMVDACRAQLAEHECETAFNPSYGEAELTLIWQESNGIWCRAKLDWLPSDRRNGMVFYDFKSTAASAHPDRYGARTAWDLRLDFQDAWYRRAVQMVLGIEARLRFVVQERDPPYALCVVEMDEEARVLAEADMGRAVEMWGQCLSSGRWPGYPTRTVHVGAPPWHKAKILAREEREPIDERMVDRMIDWQAPLEMAK